MVTYFHGNSLCKGVLTLSGNEREAISVVLPYLSMEYQSEMRSGLTFVQVGNG